MEEEKVQRESSSKPDSKEGELSNSEMDSVTITEPELATESESAGDMESVMDMKSAAKVDFFPGKELAVVTGSAVETEIFPKTGSADSEFSQASKEELAADEESCKEEMDLAQAEEASVSTEKESVAGTNSTDPVADNRTFYENLDALISNNRQIRAAIDKVDSIIYKGIYSKLTNREDMKHYLEHASFLVGQNEIKYEEIRKLASLGRIDGTKIDVHFKDHWAKHLKLKETTEPYWNNPFLYSTD